MRRRRTGALAESGKARNVSLSKTAIWMIDKMRGYHDSSLFNLSAESIDVHVRAARKRARLAGITWHDTRH